MRRAVLIPLIAGLAVIFVACTPPRRPTTWQESRTFTAAPEKLIRISGRSLDVQVSVVPAGEIVVTTRLEARSSSSRAAQRWIESHKTVCGDSPTLLEVKVPHREFNLTIVGFFHTNGTIEVKLPVGCRLEVETSSGDVEFNGPATLLGLVRVHTSSGDVTLAGGVRQLIAETTSGDVRVKGGELAALQVDTSSGDVRVDVPCAGAVVDTSSGDVRIREVAGGFSAHTSSGDVSASWSRLVPGDRVEVRTSSGDVTLRLPEDAVLSGEVRSKSGRVQSRFGSHSGRSEHVLTFDASGPAVALKVSTSSGDIRLQH